VIIISDTSPINNLAAINHLHLLHELYGIVLIPDSVYRELTDPNFPVSGAIEVQTFNWIQVRVVSDRTLVEALSNELDVGVSDRFWYFCQAHTTEIQDDPAIVPKS